MLSLLTLVNVFDLFVAVQLGLVLGQTAEQDGAAQAEDGGAPAKTVGPSVVVLALENALVEVDGVDDQSDDLEYHCGKKWRNKHSNVI